jgi:hypothetical protein
METVDARHMRLAADDKACIWHPFTQMQDWQQENPLIIERGQGNLLIDIEGRALLDGVSCLWTNVHGHRHPLLFDTIKVDSPFCYRCPLNQSYPGCGLGTINHTLLSVEALRRRELSPWGVIFVDAGAAPSDSALVRENIEAVERFGRVPVAGVIGNIDDFTSPDISVYRVFDKAVGLQGRIQAKEKPH